MLLLFSFFFGILSSPTYRATATARAEAQATESAKPTNTPSPTETPAPTNTPTATSTPTPTKTPRPQTINTPEIVPGIPGLSPQDVTLNLKQIGFECSGVDESEGHFVWECKKQSATYGLYVEVWSRKLTTVDTIDAMALPQGVRNTELEIEFLGFVATMPYDASQPEIARNWVAENLAKSSSGQVTTNIGGVEYRLLSTLGGNLTMGIID